MDMEIVKKFTEFLFKIILKDIINFQTIELNWLPAPLDAVFESKQLFSLIRSLIARHIYVQI